MGNPTEKLTRGTTERKILDWIIIDLTGLNWNNTEYTKYLECIYWTGNPTEKLEGTLKTRNTIILRLKPFD